jgi:NADPH:quinone reductase-like Zn-dependent oxidoreductase
VGVGDAGGGAGARFNPGDAVVGFVPFPHALATGMGALQGVVAIPARRAVGIPEGKTLRDAAGLLITACTADIQVSQCEVKKGQRVLVVGASGGVGTMAVQMVRDRVGSEGRVVAVCSGKNEAMVKGLGADEVSCSFLSCCKTELTDTCAGDRLHAVSRSSRRADQAVPRPAL